MIVINAKIVSTPDNIDAMREAIITMEAASRAEDGCEDYTFSQEIGDAGSMRITERWATEAALVAHFTTPHMAAFQGAMAANPPASVEVTCYEATERPMPAMS